jgi:hypothetical protein
LEDANINLLAILKQIAISGELLKRTESTVIEPKLDLTRNVIASLLIARKWLAHVDISIAVQKSVSQSLNDHYGLADANLQIQMERFHQVHLSGLYQFAKFMKWPLYEEFSETNKKPYAAKPLSAGDLSTAHLRDWSFGLTLPGKWQAHKIMSALIQGTPSLEGLKLSFTTDGLILKDVSYWRAPSVLSRVLGGLLKNDFLEGPRPMCGWVGPFQNATTLVDGVPSITGDIHIKAPAVVTQSSAAFEAELAKRQHDWFIGTERKQGETTAAWLKDMDDYYAWEEHANPKEGLQADFLGVSLMSVGGNEYTASATFELAGGKQVKYELRNTPIFVTPPSCISPPHKIHKREKALFTNVVDIDKLNEIPDVIMDESVVVINATGGKGSEIMAKAWCAEKGRHAFVRNLYGCCYSCCVRNARSCGLGFGIVIWVA